jgi:hypothetical protein
MELRNIKPAMQLKLQNRYWAWNVIYLSNSQCPEAVMSELVLHEAAASGNYHELESLLMMGRIDVNFKDAEFGDRTALHWAAARGSNMKSHSCYR